VTTLPAADPGIFKGEAGADHGERAERWSGGEAPAGSRGRASGRGSGCFPEAESYVHFRRNKMVKS